MDSKKLTEDTPRRKRPPAPQRDEVVRLVKQGKGPTEIATTMGVSRARVYQMIYRAQELGDLPRNAA